MFSALIKQKFPIVLLLVGALLAVVSFFVVEDITRLKLSTHPTPIYPVFALGFGLVILSIVVFALTESYIDWRLFSKVRTEKDGYSIKVGRADLRIRFGPIEECEASDPACVVALPANEFFDDECIADRRSALGAYIYRAFPEGVDAIRDLISEAVTKLQGKDVEKEHGRLQRSYGIAQCVYLRNPLGSMRKILLVSVTTKRKGEGLRSEPHYLFEAIGSIERFMADNRLTELHLPVMGAGHGGLREELALLYMVLAFLETLPSSLGKHLRSVNIVVFQSKSDTQPQIPKKSVKRILSFAASISK